MKHHEASPFLERLKNLVHGFLDEVANLDRKIEETRKMLDLEISVYTCGCSHETKRSFEKCATARAKLEAFLELNERSGENNV